MQNLRRGHYELAAGRDPLPFLQAMEGFANEGGMLPEQVWDDADLPAARLQRGGPTGSAMPLCWAHAEYLTLVRSRKEGVCCDRIGPVYERYARNKTSSEIEMWTFAHQPPRIRPGKRLRVITATPGTVRWSVDEWKSSKDQELEASGIGCWFADLPAESLATATRIVFTFQWEDKWEGRNFAVEIA